MSHEPTKEQIELAKDVLKIFYRQPPSYDGQQERDIAHLLATYAAEVRKPLVEALREVRFMADLAVGRDAPREAYARIIGVVDAILAKHTEESNG